MSKTCHCCGGTGVDIDGVITGESMRDLRLALRLNQSSVAKELGVSNSYVSQLESGKRKWTPELLKAYRKACGAN